MTSTPEEKVYTPHEVMALQEEIRSWMKVFNESDKQQTKDIAEMKEQLKDLKDVKQDILIMKTDIREIRQILTHKVDKPELPQRFLS